MSTTRKRQRPWPSAIEQQRLHRPPNDYSHLQVGAPCLWYAGNRWREGLLLEINRAAGALVVGTHWGGETRAERITDARNVQQVQRHG